MREKLGAGYLTYINNYGCVEATGVEPHQLWFHYYCNPLRAGGGGHKLSPAQPRTNCHSSYRPALVVSAMPPTRHNRENRLRGTLRTTPAVPTDTQHHGKVCCFVLPSF